MILITGASSGLGAALAKLYADENQDVTITGRDKNRLQQVSDASDKIQSIAADLSDESSVSALLDQLPHRPGSVIHCAGSGYFGPIETQQAT